MKIKVASILIALLALVMLTSPALAQLGIGPDSIDVTVSRGDNSFSSVTVSNNSDKPVDFKVELAGYGQRIDGSTKVLEPDSNPLSALSYIKFDPAEFHLDPGEKQRIDLIASIPEGIDGGRYAILLVVTDPKGEGPVKTVSRLGIIIKLTIAGSHLDTTGSIKLVEPGGIEPDKPIPIKVTYANEGNIHYKVQSSATISNAQGDIIGKVGSKSAVVLPGYSRELIAEWVPARDLQPGVYNILATVSLEDGTVLDEASGSFSVVAPVLAPPAPASTRPPAPAPAEVNWPLIGGIVAAVMIVALLIFFLVRRRAY